MKWFFALSEASFGHPDHDWIDLIRAAVASARANTSLEAHFVYDGRPGDFTEYLIAQGVTVHHHRLTYLGNIEQRWAALGLPPDPARLAIIAGAYLRTDIPRFGLSDEYVLYTDCDVIFRSNPAVEQFRPAFFACAPQRLKDDPTDLNSGVMLMNVPAMLDEVANFAHYIVNNFERFSAFDQDALGEYYVGRYSTLPLTLNWKPYWGSNPAAEIIHFHGPKPGVVRKILQQPDVVVPPIWRELFDENPVAYKDFLGEWDRYLAMASPFRPA